jgi:hypothetical protein
MYPPEWSKLSHRVAPHWLVLAQSFRPDVEPSGLNPEALHDSRNGVRSRTAHHLALRIAPGLPDFINHLIPIVEAQFTAPVENNFGNQFVITGTVNPGVIWVGSYFQVGLEAIVPINHASGTSVGAIGQLHFYLDDIFPNSIGKPLLGTSTPMQSMARR